MQEKIENIIDKDIEILEHLKEYLQLKIDSGYHKIFYNDLGHDEKTVDCIYALENLIKGYKEKEEENKVLSEAYIGAIKESKKWFDIVHDSTTKQNTFVKLDYEIGKRDAEINKLNKVIDEMAEHIVNSAVVDDTVCCLNVGCEDKECNYEEMLSCTKKYFIEEVENNE